MYDDYFVPNNATLVLVGDITMARAGPLAERYFGPIPSASEPPATMDLPAEPVPGGSIRLDWTEPLDPRVIVRYRVPGVGHPDRPVFDTIAAVMRSRHGMLGEKLMGSRKLASAVDANFLIDGTDPFGSPGAINFVATARRDRDLDAIETGILDAVTDLRESRIKEGTLERARKALCLDWEQIRTKRIQLAFEIGHFQVMDEWKTLLEHMEARHRASPADIQRVARRYLIPSNRVIATSRRNPPGGAQTSWLDLLSAKGGPR
jgi:zinc protease